MRQRGFDGRSQDPKLRDVYHHQQRKARLRDGRSAPTGMTMNFAWFGLSGCGLH
jgi:hypothetical protein